MDGLAPNGNRRIVSDRIVTKGFGTAAKGDISSHKNPPQQASCNFAKTKYKRPVNDQRVNRELQNSDETCDNHRNCNSSSYISMNSSSSISNSSDINSNYIRYRDKLMIHLGHHFAGDELLTLDSLYTLCRNNNQSYVLYFHNKGSFHCGQKDFRDALNCYNLNPHCITSLANGYDLCGMRISPLPAPHYSGNFFWARCDYVSKLMDPLTSQKNKTFAAIKNNLTDSIQRPCLKVAMGYGRAFSEMYIASALVFSASDCLTTVKDNYHNKTYYNHNYLSGCSLPSAQ